MRQPFDPNYTVYMVHLYDGPEDGNTYTSINRWEDYYYTDHVGVHYYQRVEDERAHYIRLVKRVPRIRRLLARWLRRLLAVG